MKKTATLLFILVGVCATTAQAKTTKTSAATPFPHFSNQESAGSSVPINTRLIKKTRYKYGGIATSAAPAEEVLYEYNSDRGSNVDIYDLSDDDVMYDVSYTNAFLPGSGIEKKLRREQQYNSNNRVDVLINRNWDGSIYKDANFYTYVYNNQF